MWNISVAYNQEQYKCHTTSSTTSTLRSCQQHLTRWLLLLCLSLLNNPHYPVGVQDRGHSMEGPLGHRWLIRHFGDIHYRQSRHIFISIVGPSDSKYAGRDTILPAMCVCSGLWRDLRYNRLDTSVLRFDGIALCVAKPWKVSWTSTATLVFCCW